MTQTNIYSPNDCSFYPDTLTSARTLLAMSLIPPPMTESDQKLTTAPQPTAPSTKQPTSTSLPKLPIPPLKDTCTRYLRALEGLQDEDEHTRTKVAVKDFLESGEGERWQKRLEEYDSGVDSYIEEFWCGSDVARDMQNRTDGRGV
jgi:hypothetical protein